MVLEILHSPNLICTHLLIGLFSIFLIAKCSLDSSFLSIDCEGLMAIWCSACFEGCYNVCVLH